MRDGTNHENGTRMVPNEKTEVTRMADRLISAAAAKRFARDHVADPICRLAAMAVIDCTPTAGTVPAEFADTLNGRVQTLRHEWANLLRDYANSIDMEVQKYYEP